MLPSTLSFPSFRVARGGRSLALLLASLGAATAFADPVVIRAGANDEVSIRSSGDGAALVLRLAAAPNSAAEARLLALNSEDYTLWSAPLRQNAGGWQATLDQEGVEALLIADRIAAEFPGAAEGNNPLRVTVRRDRVTPHLTEARAAVGNQPMFYDPPSAPEQPAMPASDAPRAEVQSFAFSIRQWDRQMSAYVHQIDAARSRAHALWLDLSTAGRIPWGDQVAERQRELYRQLEQRPAELRREREQMRQRALNFVQQWNQQHAGSGESVELAFAADAS